MPDVDGFEVLRVVRSKHPELKVVVVSGFPQGSMNQATKRLGADVALDKSLAADILLGEPKNCSKFVVVLGSGTVKSSTDSSSPLR